MSLSRSSEIDDAVAVGVAIGRRRRQLNRVRDAVVVVVDVDIVGNAVAVGVEAVVGRVAVVDVAAGQQHVAVAVGQVTGRFVDVVVGVPRVGRAVVHVVKGVVQTVAVGVCTKRRVVRVAILLHVRRAVVVRIVVEIVGLVDAVRVGDGHGRARGEAGAASRRTGHSAVERIVGVVQTVAVRVDAAGRHVADRGLRFDVVGDAVVVGVDVLEVRATRAVAVGRGQGRAVRDFAAAAAAVHVVNRVVQTVTVGVGDRPRADDAVAVGIITARFGHVRNAVVIRIEVLAVWDTVAVKVAGTFLVVGNAVVVVIQIDCVGHAVAVRIRLNV